jgi:uncharacterized protein YlxW (UPF0749 family)
MKLDRYLLIALFAGYVAKALIMSASFSDAAIVLVLAAAHFAFNSQIQNKQITELKQQVNDLSNLVNQLKDETKELKTTVAGVKIASGLRPVAHK